MANDSGRTTDLQTELDFPRGEDWLNDMLRENSAGNTKRKRIALEQFDQYLIDRYGVSDEDAIRRFEKTVEELYPKLSTLNAGHEVLKRFSYWLEDEGLAHNTIQGRFYDVRAYLNKHTNLEGVGHLDENNEHFKEEYLLKWLDTGSETRKQLDEDVHWLPLDMIDELIQGAKNKKNEMVIRCLWNFGCRPSELARIRVKNHEPEHRLFTVRTSKIDDSDHPLYRRPVFYSRSTRKHMRDWLDKGGRDAYAYADDSPYLIVGYNTPSVQARQINAIVKMAADEAEIQDDAIERADGHHVNRITARTLRHSFAVHSVRGVERTGSPPMDIERLRRILGHRSIKSTQYYLRFRDIELRDAFDRSFPD